MSADLAAFLLQRIADEEAAAREANGRVAWLTLREPDGSMRYTTVAHQHHGADHWVADGHEIDAQGVFVFYDSARVLAECEAKRAILKTRESFIAASHAANTLQTKLTAVGAVAAIDALLPYLALPYADHPDFDPLMASLT